MFAPQAFTYEVQEHEQPDGVPRVYVPLPDPSVTQANLMAMALPTPIAVNLAAPAGGPLVWAGNVPCALVNAPLNLQQACNLVLHRSMLGAIPVKFRHPNAIIAAALGMPLPVIPGGAMIYLQRALEGGGYMNYAACALYNIVFNQIYLPAIMGLAGGAVPTNILLTIANLQRVSKNVRELSYNILIQFNPFYQSVRDWILNLYMLLFPAIIPQSTTIISASHLQTP